MSQPPEPPPDPPRRRQQQEEEEEEEEEEEGRGTPPGTPPQSWAKSSVYRVGSRHCGHCLITFPDAAFAARHAKRQHPRDFAAAALRGALFVCFVCARPFGSSPALLRHQRGHAHRDTPKGRAHRDTPKGHAHPGRMPHQDTPKGHTHPDTPKGHAHPDTPPGRTLRRDTPKGHAPRLATPPPPGLACTECGRAFAREGALHRHYIRHARGEL